MSAGYVDPVQLHELRWVAAAHPTLTDIGFEDPTREAFDQHRASLISPVSVEEFFNARTWLATWPKTKRIGDSLYTDSYALKHRAEPEIGYTSNGLFIAAAIAEGFRFKADGLNAYFNIGRRRKAKPWLLPVWQREDRWIDQLMKGTG